MSRRSPGSLPGATRHTQELGRREVDLQEPVGDRRRDARQQLHRLERLQRADHARGRPEHAGVGAARRVRRRRRERAAVARGAPGLDAHHEPGHADHAGLHERHAGRAARRVDRVARVERVRAVHDEVLALDERARVPGVDPRLVRLDDHVGVEEAQLRGGALRLGHAEVRREVQQLAVQVRELDRVVVDEPDPPGPGAGEVERDRRPERARPDHQHARLRHRELRGGAPLRQHELARVALDLALGEVGRDAGAGSGSGSGGRDRVLRRGDDRREVAEEAAPAAAGHARTIRIVVPSHADRVPGLARRARDVLQRLARPAAHLERLAGGHPLELQLRPHPGHRARERR